MTDHIASVEGMSPDEITTALAEGKLDVLLGRTTPEKAEYLTSVQERDLEVVDLERLRKMHREDLIEKAREEGRLDRLLGLSAEDVNLIGRASSPSGRLDVSDLKRLEQLRRHDLILAAHRAGRVDA